MARATRECAICFEAIRDDEGVWACERCRNVLHSHCASKWHRQKQARRSPCPVCMGSPRDHARVLLIVYAPRTVTWLPLLPPRRDADGPVLLGARRPLHVRPLQHRVRRGGRIDRTCALGDHRRGPQLPTQRRARASARGAAASQQGTARRTRRLQACAATASTAPQYGVTRSQSRPSTCDPVGLPARHPAAHRAPRS